MLEEEDPFPRNYPFLIFNIFHIHSNGLTCSVAGHISIAPGLKPIPEGCFIFHFASLPLEVARPI